MAPSTPLLTGTTVLTNTPVLKPYVEVENFEIEEPTIKTIPEGENYTEIDEDDYDDF